MCHMSCVTCHVSGVTCQVSHVSCHMSRKKIYIFFLPGQSGEASRWRVCYQRGQPRLVLDTLPNGMNAFIWWTRPKVLQSPMIFGLTCTLRLRPELTFKEIMNPWMTKPGFPILTIMRNHMTRGVRTYQQSPRELKNLWCCGMVENNQLSQEQNKHCSMENNNK